MVAEQHLQLVDVKLRCHLCIVALRDQGFKLFLVIGSHVGMGSTSLVSCRPAMLSDNIKWIF